jgi:hypothetical protein
VKGRSLTASDRGLRGSGDRGGRGEPADREGQDGVAGAWPETRHAGEGDRRRRGGVARDREKKVLAGRNNEPLARLGLEAFF